MNKTFKRSAIAITIAAGLGAVSSTAIANNVDGKIKGSVISEVNKTAIQGAVVTVVDPKTGFSRTVTVDQNGEFSIPNIPVGKYQVSIVKQGYETERLNDVIIGIGKTAIIEAPLSQGNVETISVVGAQISTVDFGASESSFAITAEELEVLPVARNTSAVALLAPGTVQGDSRFGNLVSFGGSSVAENTYYINGLNMTNFRNGVGAANIPFSSYKSFQVKTGGYSAEFGRATGGVISGVTKSGSNEWEFGAEAIYTPNSLRETGPDALYQQNDCTRKVVDGAIEETCAHKVGDIFVNNSDYNADSFEMNLSASGAIIEDTLFFYGAYRYRDFTQDWQNASQSQLSDRTDDDDYWLARVDWHINDNHKIMAWAFSDNRTYSTTQFDKVDGEFSKERGTTLSTRGGESFAVRYSGNITDDFSMSAMYGEVEFNNTDKSPFDDTCPVVWDADTRTSLGCWVTFSPSEQNDTREQVRFDFEWIVHDDHTLRFGIDYEKNTANDLTKRSGGVYYRYETFNEGVTLRNGYTTTAETAGRNVRVQHYEVGGEFEIENNAIYIEDQWDVTETLRLNLGLRSDSFKNLNASGEEFISVQNQIAPRLGLSWDVTGESEHKVFANLGRYFLPVAANTNVRLAGAETFTERYYEIAGINADDTPQLGAELGTIKVYGDGEAASASTLVDHNIEPMYNDEIMLGYQAVIDDNWSWGVKFTHRRLGNQIDDGSVVEGLKKRGIDADDADHFILFNPGRPATFNYDADHDGVEELYTLTAEELGYPDAVRKYNAIDLTLERAWDSEWMFSAKYTWSQSYGNAEGYVKSDNGQDDAGLTTDWDYPYLMDGAYGFLPNDRRHVIKLFGAYTLAENLTVGVNSTIASGRPWTALGEGYTPDPSIYSYGDTYWVGDRQFPRGSMGRTPWTTDFNVNMTYKIPVADDFVTLRMDVFNVFGASNPTRYDEGAEKAIGESSATFGTPVSFQAPRRIQLTASYKF